MPATVAAEEDGGMRSAAREHAPSPQHQHPPHPNSAHPHHQQQPHRAAAHFAPHPNHRHHPHPQQHNPASPTGHRGPPPAVIVATSPYQSSALAEPSLAPTPQPISTASLTPAALSPLPPPPTYFPNPFRNNPAPQPVTPLTPFSNAPSALTPETAKPNFMAPPKVLLSGAPSTNHAPVPSPGPQQHVQEAAMPSKRKVPNRPLDQDESTLPPPPFPIGSTVDGGKIRLLDFVGQGSFAHVYLAYDTLSAANCAVKCLPKKGLDAAKLFAQRREAQALEALNGHPNVVRLFRVIDEDVDWLLIVMEFCQLVNSRTLADLFEAVMQHGGFPDQVVRRIFSQLCDGLQHCHSRGYFHRDIKPENCLIDLATMTVKLTDFGLVTRDTWSREMGCGSS
ncbi:hypothetical protein HDU96_010037, partial [Phlyctochytrium bullatum]